MLSTYFVLTACETYTQARPSSNLGRQSLCGTKLLRPGISAKDFLGRACVPADESLECSFIKRGALGLWWQQGGEGMSLWGWNKLRWWDQPPTPTWHKACVGFEGPRRWTKGLHGVVDTGWLLLSARPLITLPSEDIKKRFPVCKRLQLIPVLIYRHTAHHHQQMPAQLLQLVCWWFHSENIVYFTKAAEN